MTLEEMLKKINEIEDIEDTFTIDGEVFHYNEDSDHYSKEIKATLTSENYSFSRLGIKEISYERWIDTYWYDWD
jgi:DNA/RNA-binding domain of Phe-tRNA-synthetase-like protein